MTRAAICLTSPCVRFASCTSVIPGVASWRTKWRVNTEFSKSEIGGTSVAVFAGVSYRPSSKIGLSLDPGWSRVLDKRQYVATLDGGLPAQDPAEI